MEYDIKNDKKLILIADDEKEIRDVVGLLIRGEGYEVMAAEDGEEVLALASPEVDLYLLDVNMPRLSGIMAAAIGAVVLDIIGAKKGLDRLSLASRICAAAALVIGFINAIS